MHSRLARSLTAPATVSLLNACRAWVWRWVPPLVWMAIIFALSARPHLPSAPQPWLDLLLKKGAHFSEFGILALLWLRALSAGRRPDRRRLAAAFVITVLYAISDELHQSFVPGRHPQAIDVLIDAAGAATTLAAARLWQDTVVAGRCWGWFRGEASRRACKSGMHDAREAGTDMVQVLKEILRRYPRLINDR